MEASDTVVPAQSSDSALLPRKRLRKGDSQRASESGPKKASKFFDLESGKDVLGGGDEWKNHDEDANYDKRQDKDIKGLISSEDVDPASENQRVLDASMMQEDAEQSGEETNALLRQLTIKAPRVCPVSLPSSHRTEVTTTPTQPISAEVSTLSSNPADQTSETEPIPADQPSSLDEVEVVSQTAYEWMMQCPEEYAYECKSTSDFKIDELKLCVPYFSPPWFVKAKLAFFSAQSAFCQELLSKIESVDTNCNLARKFSRGRIEQLSTFEVRNLPIWPQSSDMDGGYKDMDSMRKSLAKSGNPLPYDQLMYCWKHGFQGSKALKNDSGAWLFTINLSFFWKILSERNVF